MNARLNATSSWLSYCQCTNCKGTFDYRIPDSGVLKHQYLLHVSSWLVGMAGRKIGGWGDKTEQAPTHRWSMESRRYLSSARSLAAVRSMGTRETTLSCQTRSVRWQSLWQSVTTSASAHIRLMPVKKHSAAQARTFSTKVETVIAAWGTHQKCWSLHVSSKV